MMIMKIGDNHIGLDKEPYVIAELSANHNGDIDNLFQLISKAHECGASAVKIQTYRPDTITLNCRTDDFKIHGGLWDGRYLYDLYEEAHTPWEWHEKLFEHAKKVGITLFSSPFDNTAVDLLEELGAPAYKIASFETIDLPLIEYVSSKKKPVIISTGMATLDEIIEAKQTATNAGAESVCVLHCVSGYPASASDYNLSVIKDLRERLKCDVGLSDHTLDNVTAITSVAFGSCIIEKHFTLDRNGGGPDDKFSLEPSELKSLCRDVKVAWDAIGTVSYELAESEKSNLKFRRSLYFVKDLKKNDVIEPHHIRSVRPGFGLAPKYLSELIGKRVQLDVSKFTPVSFDKIKR